ncbi:MAG TPA: acetylxylan esterase [Candidatus Hydrogenedentes bacterium]|jgi:dienelactone hydrolase|nr:acetylxylan esterase [Candidatus Hydrogenedentota bacterium]HPJ98140.1 acetylxylan esterase [Candidatus Hydrogenedentota bacterium]
MMGIIWPILLGLGALAEAVPASQGPLPAGLDTGWAAQADQLRQTVREILTFPAERVALDAQTHRSIDGEGYRIECVTYQSEADSRVTAHLYLPAPADAPVPGIVLACGHGGSKSSIYYQYAGQLYAKLGFACFIPDTIGEEERHKDGKMGTRAHDMYEFGKDSAARRAFTREKLGRMVLGKIVWDLVRGLDYLETRPDIDPARLGVMGNSMGGTTSSLVAAIDTRVRAAVISGWSMTAQGAIQGKDCSKMPFEALAHAMSFDELNALLASHAATLFINGGQDSIIDVAEGGLAVVRRTRATVAGARQILADAGIPGIIEAQFVAGACHRPYILTRPAAAWFQEYLQAPEDRRPLPAATIKLGDWVDAHGLKLEPLYDTEPRQRGTDALDIGAQYRVPAELACFPGSASPDPAYTWEGWKERRITESEARD